MENSPEHIQQLQLKIWLAKSPGERLKQFLIDDEQFFKFIHQAKKSLEKKN